jgi:L-alanine-DL-glutamate epimerase-like enolase superfamily enzyme
MAKIAQVEIMMVDLPPTVPRTDAIQSFVSQETPIVRITDTDGAIGTGYSYTIGTGGPAVMSLIERTFAPQLLGRDAEEIEAIWRHMLFSTHATSVGAITSLALAAVDVALWDLRCRRAGLPLWRLAGGAKPSTPLYTTEGGWLQLPAEVLVEDALAARAGGFAGSKVKIGKPALSEDRARIEAVRAAVGDEFQILTDANQGFSLAEALRRSEMLASLEVGWFEEPMPADDVGSHAQLAARSRVPIAVGESLYSISQFKDYLVQGAASIVQVDVARIGGVTPWLKTAHMAEAFNVSVCPHFLMELHVSLVCAVPNAPLLEIHPATRPHNPIAARPARWPGARARGAGDRDRLGLGRNRGASNRRVAPAAALLNASNANVMWQPPPPRNPLKPCGCGPSALWRLPLTAALETAAGPNDIPQQYPSPGPPRLLCEVERQRRLSGVAPIPHAPQRTSAYRPVASLARHFPRPRASAHWFWDARWRSRRRAPRSRPAARAAGCGSAAAVTSGAPRPASQGSQAERGRPAAFVVRAIRGLRTTTYRSSSGASNASKSSASHATMMSRPISSVCGMHIAGQHRSAVARFEPSAGRWPIWGDNHTNAAKTIPSPVGTMEPRAGKIFRGRAKGGDGRSC